MAKNGVSKYSKTGGLNPLWVEQDIQRRNQKQQDDYINRIAKNTADSVAKTLNNASMSSNNKYNNSKLKLEDELEIKFNFLKRHSDGTETEYQMAKHVLGV